MTPAELDALVDCGVVLERALSRAQETGMPITEEAFAVWDRARQFVASMNQLPRTTGATVERGGRAEPQLNTTPPRLHRLMRGENRSAADTVRRTGSCEKPAKIPNPPIAL